MTWNRARRFLGVETFVRETERRVHSPGGCRSRSRFSSARSSLNLSPTTICVASVRLENGAAEAELAVPVVADPRLAIVDGHAKAELGREERAAA